MTRYLFVDNCPAHKITPDVQNMLKRSNTVMRFLPKNATHLIQPADSFVIQKVKAAWIDRWEQKKTEMILEECWKDGDDASGKLLNPGKKFFLKLASESVRHVNNQRGDDGLTYARKAMIRCGLCLDLNGIWQVSQLYPHLQEIIRKYPDDFNNAPPFE